MKQMRSKRHRALRVCVEASLQILLNEIHIERGGRSDCRENTRDYAVRISMTIGDSSIGYARSAESSGTRAGDLSRVA